MKKLLTVIIAAAFLVGCFNDAKVATDEVDLLYQDGDDKLKRFYDIETNVACYVFRKPFGVSMSCVKLPKKRKKKALTP